MSEIRVTMSGLGEGPTLHFSDGRTVDLSRKIRLVKSDLSSHGAGFSCEGVLTDSPSMSSEYGGPMMVHLRFVGGSSADWCPELGDMIENVE